jgi:hypothetical protein
MFDELHLLSMNQNCSLFTLFLMYQEDSSIPMFSDSGFIPSEQNEQRNSKCFMIFLHIVFK